MANKDLDYSFPDEPETSGATLDEFEIEIEDDTPEEDRGRTPADPEKVRQLEVEVDDLDKYSKEAKDKLIRMKRVWNDERRAREAAEREQHAAIEAAQKLYAENQRIKSLVNSKADEYQDMVATATKVKLKAAKKAFREAYEAGDADAMAEAQADLTKYQIEMDAIKKSKPKKALQDEFDSVQPPQIQQVQQVPRAPRPDSRVMEWQDENPWFGQDKVMTATALGVHEQLHEDGVEVGSEDYYAKLDRAMRKRFPERFEEAPAKAKADSPKPKPSTVVASANRTTAPKRVRLTQTQVALAKKLGLTPEQYARELMRMEA